MMTPELQGNKRSDLGRREAQDSTKEKIASNLAVFEYLVHRAENFAARNKQTAAAAYAGVAAAYAMWNHTGIWASPRLERILIDIGQRIGGRIPYGGGKNRRNGTPKNVLHVLTQAYSVGGHTRFVWRWIQQDTGRSHSVALTRQGTKKVPNQLVEAVEGTGGRVHFLDVGVGGLLAWARSLRKLALGFDQIVLHIHPCDVVPIIALAERRDLPPVVFMNHIDNVFWLGVGIADVVTHIRESGLDVSTELRGVERDRCLILPIPVDEVERKLSRTEAKRQLGLADDAVVLLSIAAQYKYEPILGESSYADVLSSVLRNHENCTLLVAGAEPRGQWEKAIAELGPRFRVLGKREDTDVLYQAADIYLDSFPVCSLTSLLEAGSYELPLITLSPCFEKVRLLCADCPGFASTLIRKTEIDDYKNEISRLVEDPELRLNIGKKTRNEILNAHAGKNWLGYLEHAYSSAAKVGNPVLQPYCPEASRAEYLNDRLVCIYDHQGTSRQIEEIVHSEIGVLPCVERLRLWLSMFHCRPDLLVRFALSEWALNHVRAWVSRIKVWRHRDSEKRVESRQLSPHATAIAGSK